MKIVCTVKTEADALRASLLAKIINDDPKFAGIVVIVKQEDEARLPRINVGTIGHINHGRVNVFGLGGAIMGILALQDFSCGFPEIKIVPQHISRSSSKNHFEKLSRRHRARSHQGIVRTGLTPRPTKRKRVRFHFRFR